MQVDLLLPETQRRPPLAKGDDLHAEHPRVEIAGARDIGDGQDEMIETRDLHGRPRNRDRGVQLATHETRPPSRGDR